MRATTKLAQLMPIEKAINNFVKISTIEEILRYIKQSLETNINNPSAEKVWNKAYY